MKWIKTDFQIPLQHKGKKLWFYDWKNDSVYSGYIPEYLYPDKVLEYLQKNNITHWLPYYPNRPE